MKSNTNAKYLRMNVIMENSIRKEKHNAKNMCTVFLILLRYGIIFTSQDLSSLATQAIEM